MNKTKEELNELKQEYETLKTKFQNLSEDEINQVTGGEQDIIFIRGLESISPYASSEYSSNIDWKSNNDVPTEPGNYKIG